MPKKQVRFSDLVKQSGKPEVVSLWTDPSKDPVFTKAVRENRVMTLVQEPGSKRKDWGEIGFHQEPHASYFVFPEPLPEGAPQRVIGIKYDLMAQPRVNDPVSGKDLKPRRRSVRHSEPPPKPQEKPTTSFNVIIRRVAVLESSLDVSARTKKEAQQKALEMIKAEPFDTSKAVFKEEIKAVQ